MTTPMFQAVGAADGEITFGSVVPIAAEDVDLSWNIGVQFLLYTGDTDWDNDYTWDGEKWLKDGYLDATETPIPAGQGLWVNNGTYSPVALRSSGEVNKKEVEYPMNDEGGTAAGNPYPCQITFSQLIPLAEEGVDLSWNIGVQFLLYTGDTDWDNDYTWDGEKWLKDGYLDASDMPIPAGQGIWINNGTYSPVTLHVVAPELD